MSTPELRLFECFVRDVATGEQLARWERFGDSRDHVRETTVQAACREWPTVSAFEVLVGRELARPMTACERIRAAREAVA